MVPWDRKEGKDSGTTGVPTEGTEGRTNGPIGQKGRKRQWDY